MDSLTQIVLGASVAELALGKKIGNRAMVWGAIAGTIPDLDVIGNFFMSEVDALAFHRGVSHSIVFSIIMAVLMGLLANRFFDREDLASKKEWIWMFFLSLFTHPILDSFTSYGTQLFAPFSDYRVAWSNISVADPLYTVPFLICLIITACYSRTSSKRAFWNRLGLTISSVYMIFTLFNKRHIVKTFERSLVAAGVDYNQKLVSPTILNNALWFCIAETDSSYVKAHYSIFDKSSQMQLEEIPKKHDVLAFRQDDRTIQILKWFTRGFYNIVPLPNGHYQLNDLRYGTMTIKPNEKVDPDNYVFRFELIPQEDGTYEMTAAEGGPKTGDEREMLRNLWQRIQGI